MPVRPSPGGAVSRSYRITVRGVMSERFCRAFPGMRHRVDGDRTVLEGVPDGCRPVGEVLATLDNLGVDVIDVEGPDPRPQTTKETRWPALPHS